MPPELPDVYFGTVSETKEAPPPPVDEDEDEEVDEDAPAAEDLIELLGFDPDDVDWSPAEDAAFHEEDHPRGQPGNAGQFGPGGGSKTSTTERPTPERTSEPGWRDLDFPSAIKGERYGKGAPLWAKAIMLAAQKAGGKPMGGFPRGTEVQGRVNSLALIANTEDKDGTAGDHAKFMLDHAKIFKFDESSFKCKKGKSHYCYNNAYQAAMADPSLTYVEGFTEGGGVGAHAWVVDKSGKVIDPTIKSGSRIAAYIGVPIKTEYLRKVTERELDKEQDHSKHWGVFTSEEYLEDDPSTFVKSGLGEPLPKPDEYTKDGM